MWRQGKILAVLSMLLLAIILSQSCEPQPDPQDYANFKPDELIQMRFIIYKSYIIHSSNRNTMASYIRNESFFSFSSNWNVFINDNSRTSDYYYTTAAYNKAESNKKYYRDYNYQGFGYTIIVIETNNTKPGQDYTLSQGELATQSTKISKDVTIMQYQAISDSVDQVAQHTNDFQQYSIALQQAIMDRLGQNWHIYTQDRSFMSFGVAYTSPYNQWIEYQVSNFNVYIWRNYING